MIMNMIMTCMIRYEYVIMIMIMNLYNYYYDFITTKMFTWVDNGILTIDYIHQYIYIYYSVHNLYNTHLKYA